jgi:sugar/nucleoside kinase (ribokinase family)
VGADVAQQPTAGEHDRKEQPEEQRRFSWSVVTRSLDEEDEGGNGDQQQRDDAMEPSGLGMRPRVERADDLYAPTEQTDDGRRAKLTVVTRGERGCTAYTEEETFDVPGFPVDAVSTLGAGDVFHGALLTCLSRGLPLRNSLVRANACVALSCRALDGRSTIPSWDELEASVG